MKTYTIEVTYTVRIIVTAPDEETAIIEATERAGYMAMNDEIEPKPRIISER